LKFFGGKTAATVVCCMQNMARKREICMLRLEEIRNKIIEMGLQIGLDGNSPLYPAFSELDKVFNEGASIYVTSSQYHYIIFERGNVIKHYKSREIENIIYPLFKSITMDLASKYELKHRSGHDDTRRLRWKKQLELLKIVDTEFYEKRKKEIEEILKTFPYVQS
jgi:hypothetical protein